MTTRDIHNAMPMLVTSILAAVLLLTGCSAKSHVPATSWGSIDPQAREIRQQGYELLGLAHSPVGRLSGERVRVAVLDTGIDLESRDVTSAARADFTGSDTAADDNGHGTKVAGIIGARLNGSGLIGIAPKSDLLIAKVADGRGYVQTDNLIDGIDWAIEQKADVINISLEISRDSSALRNAIKRATSQGILVLASSGNTTEGATARAVALPAKYPEVISVGMLDKSGQLSKFSFEDTRVDVYAPGEDLVATYPGDKLTIDTGASFATAWASGYAALLLNDSRARGAEYNRVQAIADLQRDLDGYMDSPMYDPIAVGLALLGWLGVTLVPSAVLTWVLPRFGVVHRLSRRSLFLILTVAFLLVRWTINSLIVASSG